MKGKGSLACVGLGMTLGAHISPRSRNHIAAADVVFAAVSDPIVELWLQEMHPNVQSLQPFYGVGKSRHETYREMVAAMLDEVRKGKKVCGAFYGHPGVFARAPHVAVAQALAEGFDAVMEPGISAEDCLYADLGIDPGQFGCQHYEASQLMFYRRRIDPSAYLVLWQVGVAGDRSFGRFSTSPERLQLLVERLSEDYPLDHGCLLYEAPTLALHVARKEPIELRKLPGATLDIKTTMVLPPAIGMEANTSMLAKLNELGPGLDG